MRSVRIVFVIVSLVVFFAADNIAQNAFTYEEQKLVKSFEKRATDYANTRIRIERRLPKLPKAASMEQISAHKAAHRSAIQRERAKERAGNIFTPEAATMIRQMIKREFTNTWEGSEIRASVLEAETQGAAVTINTPYPDSAELIEMSPTLLLSLPQLPAALRYRFIGRSLVLMDRDNALIIDHMPNALP